MSDALRAQPDACVHLTFDDGPDPEWTPQVLDVLAAAEMRATFFSIGRQAQRYPELIRRVSAAGHEIANHTFDHRHPWTMSARVARSQVRDGALALGDILGHSPRLYRSPHGRNRACMIEEAARCGEMPVGWDLSAVDWGPFGISRRIGARLRRIQPRDIVLMHDGRNRHNRPDQLLQALPAFLDELRLRRLHSMPLG
ncbi:MAG TPA: polysaccharide deacetylase family protein [Povalibacter sp.]|nr:polysaccharide deacetylase family protein [Povalibacter sp.]